MSDGNRDKTATAPLVAILAADTDFHEHLPTTFPHFPGARDMFAGTPQAASRRPGSTPLCRPATSWSASARPGSPPAR